jgi:hypothetical protein
MNLFFLIFINQVLFPVIAELGYNYKTLKNKGMDIVTVYADTDQGVFEKNVELQLWSHKYCDLKGVKGVNFKS